MQLRSTGLTWHVAGDDVVVLDVERSVYLKLNSTGRVLWEQLGEPCSIDELERSLVDRYGIDADRAHDDVGSFLAEMRERDLLEE